MSRQSLPTISLRIAAITAAIFICSMLSFGQVETILHDFVALPHGSTPEAPVIADAAGNLYGTTAYGGLYGQGTVFKVSQGSNGKWTETVLYNFTNTDDGAAPAAGLIFDATGNLYGTTTVGGAVCPVGTCYNAAGTVFKLSPNSNGTWSLTTLYSFGATGDGIEPLAALTFDKAGNLYGTTFYGGTRGYGTVFELSPNSQGGWTETILLNFTDEQDGGNPTGGVTIDAAGNVYGSATVGGDVNCQNYGYQPWGCGVVYELTRNSGGTWSETILHSFVSLDGSFPNGNVIFDNSGNLMGTTASGPGTNCGFGCGTVYKLSPGSSGSWTLKTVYTFAGGLDGASPQSGLVLGADGNFYGTTSGGGDANNCLYSCGTIFSLTPSTGFTWKERIIHHFSGSATNPYGVDGNDPVAGLAFDQLGNLYGTAKRGGAAGGVCNQCSGTVYKLSKNSSGQWITSLLTSFVASGDGLSPSGYPTTAPVSGTSGNLFGTTQYGGANGNGAVYELIAQSGGGYKERVIYSFQGPADGLLPIGGLVADSAGNLYGATYYGGVNAQCTYSYGCGTIFELSPASGGKWTFQTLYALATTDGVSVNGPLAFDGNGNLIGTTSGNNQGGLSTAFQLTPSGSGWTFTILHTFTGNDVFTPSGPLILDSSGNWLGVGQGGNHGAGVAYELSPSSGYTTTVLHTFAGGADGSYPVAPLVNRNGVLIGATYEGGSTTGPCTYGGCGTIFALAKSGSTWQKKTIYTFTGGTDASNPAYGLTADTAGNLYGTSWAGGSTAVNCQRGNGSGGCGTVFKLTQSGGVWTESVLYDFGLVSYDVSGPANLLWTSSNILYGTGGGGEDGNGVVFQLDLNQSPQFAATQAAAPQWHPVASAAVKSGKAGN